MARKNVLCILLVLAAAVAIDAAERRKIDFEYVVSEARKLSENAYRAPDTNLPEALESLDYDGYRDLRFRPEQALWRRDGLPWALEMFHRGYLYKEPVEVYEFTDTHVQKIRFVADWFDYGPRTGIDQGAWFPSRLDYAGIRLKYPQNDPKIFDEIAVFQGASYFRMLGKDQLFGLSARGIAVNTLRGEDFPRFTKFWLKRPDLESEEILIYALLDGETVAGAYQFRILPGETLRTQVKCTVFLRKDVERLGFAPFSSMFYFGENTVQPPPDYRPEVHDSDGLLIARSDGNFHWRPLTNEFQTKDSVFPANDLQGFGLLQRDRSFTHYQDLESSFERRPTAWVQPVGNWPNGKVRLIELLSRNEIMDNIVAFWEPDEHPEIGEPYTLEYVIHWELEHPTPLGKVIATRAGRSVNYPDQGTIVIDFSEIPEDRLPADAQPAAMVSVGDGGKLLHLDLKRNPHTGGWRLALQLETESTDTANRRGVPIEARLDVQNQPITEIWTYLWIPPE